MEASGTEMDPSSGTDSGDGVGSVRGTSKCVSNCVSCAATPSDGVATAYIEPWRGIALGDMTPYIDP